jgi:hypothetical protein
MTRKAKLSKAANAEVVPDVDADAGKPEPATNDNPTMIDDATNTEDVVPPTAAASSSTSSPPSAKTPAGGDTRSSKKAKRQFPPPFPDLIYGYHANDVLNGRGATINVHPGNKQFRDLCASRKEEFDSARNIQKREIALQIVQSVLEWNPPGRFLERANDSNNANDNPEDDEVEAYFREVDVDEVLTGSSAKYFNEKGLCTKKNKTLMRELGPWRDMGMERAIQKVCGVIRDHKRPDRIALKAMGLLKVKNTGTVSCDFF